MKLVYLGTPELAVRPLEALRRAGHEIELVVTQPDRRRGRGSTLQPSPVKAAAQEWGIPVTDRVDDVLDTEAELGVVVAFGRLIKPHVLERLPMINLHFSLLPRWRGAAPVERAILAGDTTTGVCVMEVVDELDAGGIYRQSEVAIAPGATLDELRAELVEVGSVLLVGALMNGLGDPVPQTGEVVYAQKLDRNDFRLDLDEAAERLGRVIRLGGAWAEFRGRRLLIWRAMPDTASARSVGSPSAGTLFDDDGQPCVVTGDGVLRLIEVQPEGRGRMDAEEWWRGIRREPGEQLT